MGPGWESVGSGLRAEKGAVLGRLAGVSRELLKVRTP